MKLRTKSAGALLVAAMGSAGVLAAVVTGPATASTPAAASRAAVMAGHKAITDEALVTCVDSANGTDDGFNDGLLTALDHDVTEATPTGATSLDCTNDALSDHVATVKAVATDGTQETQTLQPGQSATLTITLATATASASGAERAAKSWQSESMYW